MSTVRDVLDAGAARLTVVGVESAEYDAAELLAFVLGTTRSRLPLVDDVADGDRAAFEALVDRRALREPLQHLTGTAPFRHAELAVGPGVFVPRPETELLAGWAIDRARALGAAVVVDLCTGSGAIARSVADEAPRARVHAIEVEEAAHKWAQINLSSTAVDLRLGDMVHAFPELDGEVDVVVCNPPYIPYDAWSGVSPEARDHDPHVALFSTGDDGLDAIRVVEAVAARLLKRGGWVGVEHADLQGESAPRVFATSGRWAGVRDHRDLAGRPRYLTARRAG